MPESLPLQPGNWSSLNDYLENIEKYRLISDGTTVTAYGPSGTLVASGPDGGAVVAALLPAAASAGATIELRNDGHAFPWGSIPGLPAGITGRLLIRGNGATVQLSVAAPRFLDFKKVADGDTFQNIEIDGLVVDANNVDADVGGIIGTFSGAGTWLQNVNFDRISIRRLKIINLPTSANFRGGIMLGVQNNLADPLHTITNITVADYDQSGGLSGIMVEGVPNADLTANVKLDNIVVDRWRVVRPAAPVAFVSGGQDILVGGKGYGGSCAIRNGYGFGSTDVGIECDSMGTANIENCIIEDSWNAGFYHTNYKAADATDTATINYRGCTAKRTTVQNAMAGWKFALANALPLRRIRVRDCAYVSTVAYFHLGCNAITTTGCSIDDLLVDGFRSDITGFSWDSTVEATLTTGHIYFGSLSTSAQSNVRLRNLSLNAAGVRTGATNFLTFQGITTGGKCNLLVDGLDWTVAITGQAAGSSRAVAAFGATGGVNLDLRNLRVLSATGDTNAVGLQIWNTASLLVANYIRVSECDFSGLPSSNELNYQTAGQNNDKVFVRNNIWKVKPAPTSLTGLVTATGLQLKTGYPVIVQCTPGSGAAITAIDYSTNGGTTYTNLLTQASGAMPASPTLIEAGPLSSDALVKVTFTTTQPTITLVPVNP